MLNEKQSMLRELGRMGFDTSCLVPMSVQVTTCQYENDKDRFSAWLVESLYAGFVALEAKDFATAIRCSWQVREYLGRCGGSWPGSHVHDASSELQNQILLILRAL